MVLFPLLFLHIQQLLLQLLSSSHSSWSRLWRDYRLEETKRGLWVSHSCTYSSEHKTSFSAKCSRLKMATSFCYSSHWEVKSNPVHSETGRDCDPWRPTDYNKRDAAPVSQAQALKDSKLASLLLQSTCSLSFTSGLDRGIASCSWCGWSCLGSNISQVFQSCSYNEWGLWPQKSSRIH